MWITPHYCKQRNKSCSLSAENITHTWKFHIALAAVRSRRMMPRTITVTCKADKEKQQQKKTSK